MPIQQFFLNKSRMFAILSPHPTAAGIPKSTLRTDESSTLQEGTFVLVTRLSKLRQLVLGQEVQDAQQAFEEEQTSQANKIPIELKRQIPSPPEQLASEDEKTFAKQEEVQ
jgi:hypothetical protein